MQKDTLELIKAHINDDLQELLTTAPEQLRDEMLNKSEDAHFQDGMKKHPNPKLPLFLALQKAERKRSGNTVREVLRTAVRADEFLTAYMEHEIAAKSNTITPELLEHQYLLTMANLHTKKDTKGSLLMTGTPSDMLSQAPKLCHDLRNPDYLKASAEYRKELAEATQKAFNDAEYKTLRPLAKRADRRNSFGLLLALIIWIAGGWLVLRSFGPVWRWTLDFFTDHLTPLIILFWIVPILYALIAGGLALWLGAEVSELPGKNATKKLKKKIAALSSNAVHSIRHSDAAQTLEQMDQHLPQTFRSYGSRLVLSALCAIHKEEAITKLCQYADTQSTWLTQAYPPAATGENPYDGKVRSLLRPDEPTDQDIFLAHTLRHKQKDYYEDFGTDAFPVQFLDGWIETPELGYKMHRYAHRQYSDVLNSALKENRPMPKTAQILHAMCETVSPYYANISQSRVLAQYEAEAKRLIAKHSQLSD